MALEEITTEIDVQKPAKTKDKPKPKKPLASMKKRDESVAPYPFKSKGELAAYRKNMESIVKPGYGEMGRKERPVSEMVEMLEKKSSTPKPKVGMMKKLGEAAGEAVRELPHQNEKFTIRKAHDYDGEMKDEKPVVNELMKRIIRKESLKKPDNKKD